MTTAPRLSVIVPTFNRASVIVKSVEALLGQSCDPASYEVIVSDDGSRDETRARVRPLVEAHPGRVLYLHQENAGANAARNHAIREARGALLLLINDDTIATRRMLEEHLLGHEDHPEDNVAVLGRVTIAPELPPSRLAPLHLDRAYAALGGRTEHDWRAFFTCNVSVKKSLLLRGGLFEERIRYHEDLELAERLSHHGLRVVYRPEALGYHDHFLTEEEFFAIAAREAKALTTWAGFAPHLHSVLGTLGFEPAVPRRRQLLHQALRLAVNRATIPAWKAAARHWPRRFPQVSLAIYNGVYQCVRRSHLRRELRRSALA